jgi:hypothetical protein
MLSECITEQRLSNINEKYVETNAANYYMDTQRNLHAVFLLTIPVALDRTPFPYLLP